MTIQQLQSTKCTKTEVENKEGHASPAVLLLQLPPAILGFLFQARGAVVGSPPPFQVQEGDSRGSPPSSARLVLQGGQGRGAVLSCCSQEERRKWQWSRLELLGFLLPSFPFPFHENGVWMSREWGGGESSECKVPDL